jgi:RNA polymerase sigma-70 factor (ECF subfamily)
MDTKLNQIATLWSVVKRAHADPGDQARAAQEALLERYGGAVRRYLLGALRDHDAADELFQEFAYRFLHGGLKGADRERGRFRDYVKGVLFHLVADYHQRRRREPGQLSTGSFEPGKECSLAAEREEAFRMSWRDDLLIRVWAALKEVEEKNAQPFYTVLRFRAENPDLSSSEMAEKLSQLMGKPLTAAGVRKTLERSRDRFGDLLLDEIAEAIDNRDPDALAEELSDLGLLEHCRAALERRRRERGT